MAAPPERGTRPEERPSRADPPDPPSVHPDGSAASTRRSNPDPDQPTEQELRISARLLLHLARQPRTPAEEIPPETLTQAGMALALGTSQAAVSNALTRLVDGGALQVERSHVRGQLLRLKVYRLTPRGEAIVRQIRKRFGV